MINRVLLRNWRGYEKLSLDFGPGLSFVIADNGVGKTSLVEAVSWALFGSASGVDCGASVRAGTDEASVEVDATIGDLDIAVQRSLLRTGRGRERSDVQIDGARIPPADLAEAIAHAAGVTADMLPQLMFVPEMRLAKEGQLFRDVQEHLASLLGIEPLRKAARTARELNKRVAKQIRAVRAVERTDESTVADIQERQARLSSELDEITAAIAEDIQRRDQLDPLLRGVKDWQSYDAAVDEYQRKVKELAAQAQAIGLESAPDALSTAEAQLDQESDELRATLADAHAEHGLVEGLVDQLHSAEARCPVCLRAMDSATARHAAESHQARLAELDQLAAATELRRQEVEAAVAKLHTITIALARLQSPRPPNGERPNISVEEVEEQRKVIDQFLAESQARKGALTEQLRQLDETLDQMSQSTRAEAELAELHSVAAASDALARLADEEAALRTEQSLGPLSTALADRWNEFFAGRGAPRLAGAGSIELGAGEATIPYTSFSGGERTLASLLTRLLLVSAATGLHSMWLDEPLEHLDPANRTRVARLLAQATRPGSHMRQVVVTTYEEAIARSMASRHDGVTIVYVSTDPLL